MRIRVQASWWPLGMSRQDRAEPGGRKLIRLLGAVSFLSLLHTAAHSQSQTTGGMPPPPGMSLAASAAMRFPQPVRVGDLLQEDVLEPVESQIFLGTVQQIVRDKSGSFAVVIKYGSFLGFGTRLIAVPVDAMVVIGRVMEVVAFTPEQLRQLPTFSPLGTSPVSPDTIIEVGLAKPSH